MPVSQPIRAAWEQIEAALQAIMNRCDGAHKLDGEGYSKYDRDDAAELLDNGWQSWDDAEKGMALSFTRKYSRQLREEDINSDAIIAAATAVEGRNGIVEVDDSFFHAISHKSDNAGIAGIAAAIPVSISHPVEGTSTPKVAPFALYERHSE